MNEQHICLKSVGELRLDLSGNPIRYRIPPYQRGYRWTPTQVTQLLEDIREFTKRDDPKPEEFYCLQPLVLRPAEKGVFDVVDGQQRLITLFLILRHFNARLTERYRQKLYTLEYSTRPHLQRFLENPSAAAAKTNIDFFHIAQAIQTIETWFDQRDSEVEAIKDAFLNKTKVIRFQLSAEENAVAAFTRLNVGKIPLTNGELIRALFLRQGKEGSPGEVQLRIAHDWDVVEKSLQNNEFWCFLSNDITRTGGRIDFVFDLVASLEGMPPSTYEYATFSHFVCKFAAKGTNPETIWRAVKEVFMLLEEWVHDPRRRLYHLVGFLIWHGMNVKQLCEMAAGKTKQAFREQLRVEVFNRAMKAAVPADLSETEFRQWVADQLDGLVYRPGSSQIRSVLLLFNLATLLQHSRSNMRFNFQSFKTEAWDIEHVRSIADDGPDDHKGHQAWLQNCLGYLQSAKESPELQVAIEAFLKLPRQEATSAAFDELYGKLLQYFQEAGDAAPDHSIANLVLLDCATNRGYKNAVFAVKRQRILSLDRDGVFVPLCTRNVFLKCYNARVEHVMFWTQKDRDGYRQAMIDTLCTFYTGGWINDING